MGSASLESQRAFNLKQLWLRTAVMQMFHFKLLKLSVKAVESVQCKQQRA